MSDTTLEISPKTELEHVLKGLITLYQNGASGLISRREQLVIIGARANIPTQMVDTLLGEGFYRTPEGWAVDV